MTFYTLEDHKERAKVFLDRYELQSIITCPTRKPDDLKLRKERICRFCGLKEPETTFKKVAHIIPALIGNQNLISDFECDSCNEKFGIYENDFAHYLGISRTLNGIKSNNRVPKYKTFDELFAVENKNFQTDDAGNIFISRNNPAEQKLTVDVEKGTLVLNYPMKPYIPLHVYKSLLKMALSCLPVYEIGDYSHAMKYVVTKAIDKAFTGASKVVMHSMTLGINYTQPMALLFKKRNQSDKIFSHWFHLYFQNFIFQFFIPLNENDFSFYNAEIQIDFAPPLFSDITTAASAFTLGITSQLLDLSSPDLRKRDISTFNMYMGIDQLTDVGLIDPSTGEAIIDESALHQIVGLRLSRTHR